MDIKTEMVEVVRSKCPIAPLFYERDFEFDKKCAMCDFLFAPNQCGWDVYKVELHKKESYTDDDEYCDGGMPSTDYSRYIKCCKCGNMIGFHSGFSWFGFGDKETCKKCGTVHMYIKGSRDGLLFAVPKDMV